MKWLLIIAGILVCLVILVLIVGYMLPVKHTATVSVKVHANAQQVWNRLKDIRNYPEWRRNIKSVEVASDSSWVEVTTSGDRLPLAFVSEAPATRLETKITGDKLPYGGGWEILLQTEGSGSTLVTITEHGEVYNPVFRFVSKFILGHQATIRQYADFLEQSFQ